MLMRWRASRECGCAQRAQPGSRLRDVDVEWRRRRAMMLMRDAMILLCLCLFVTADGLSFRHASFLRHYSFIFAGCCHAIVSFVLIRECTIKV
jgi:hypothetical protein